MLNENSNVGVESSSIHREGGFLDTVKTLGWAVLIALVIRTFAFEPFSIPSGSMIPTLLVGDYLFVSKYSYGYSRFSLPFGLPLIPGRILFSEPERGDVAVFRLPTNDSVDYIKRIIGLPGDQIQVVRGVLHINGKPVARDRVDDFITRNQVGDTTRIAQYVETLPNGVKHRILEAWGDYGPVDNTPVFTVPEGHYFMMGDNRDNSTDSRFINEVGFVPRVNLVGRAEVLFFSKDGDTAFWEIWKWPWALRLERFFERIS